MSNNRFWCIYELFWLKLYIVSAKTYDFYMFACFAFMYALLSCFQTCILSSDIKRAHIVRTLQNRIPFQKFESYSYASYIKSKTSDIWKTGAWFYKPFEERVEENHIYHLVKLNSAVKTRTVHRGYNICYQVFLENGKIDL